MRLLLKLSEDIKSNFRKEIYVHKDIKFLSVGGHYIKEMMTENFLAPVGTRNRTTQAVKSNFSF